MVCLRVCVCSGIENTIWSLRKWSWHRAKLKELKQKGNKKGEWMGL